MHLPGRFILIGAAGLFLFSLISGALGVFAFPAAVSDFVADVTGLRQSTIKALLDPATGKISLSLLPTGHGSGLDADRLDGQHASFFATSADLADTRSDLQSKIDRLGASVSGGSATTLGGYSGSFYRDAGNLTSGTLSDRRLSGNVVLIDLAQTITALKTFSGGITVSGGQLTLPPGSIIDSALSGNVDLLGSAQTFTGMKTFGAGLSVSGGTVSFPSASIADTTLSGNVALLAGSQTFSGAKTFSALLSANNGLTVAGPLTLPLAAINDMALSANVGLLNLAQTFTATKTFLPLTASAVPLITKGLSAQTGDLFQAQASTGTVLAKVDAAGNLTAVAGSFSGTLTAANGLTVTASGASITGQSTLTVGSVPDGGNGIAENITLVTSGTSQVAGHYTTVTAPSGTNANGDIIGARTDLIGGLTSNARSYAVGGVNYTDTGSTSFVGAANALWGVSHGSGSSSPAPYFVGVSGQARWASTLSIGVFGVGTNTSGGPSLTRDGARVVGVLGTGQSSGASNGMVGGAFNLGATQLPLSDLVPGAALVLETGGTGLPLAQGYLNTVKKWEIDQNGVLTVSGALAPPNADRDFGDASSPTVRIHAGGVAAASIKGISSGGNTDLQIDGQGSAVLRLGSNDGTVVIGRAAGGTISFANSITINGGTAILKHLSATGSIAFGSIAAQSCATGTVPVTGAATGDAAYATPTPVASGIDTMNLTWSAWVSAAGTVTVRACNGTAGALAPASQTWRADVWQH